MARVRVNLETDVVHCCTCGRDFEKEMANPCPGCGVTATEIEYRKGKSQGLTQFMVRHRTKITSNLHEEKLLALDYCWQRDILPTYAGYTPEFVEKKRREFFLEGGFTFESGKVYTKGGEFVAELKNVNVEVKQ